MSTKTATLNKQKIRVFRLFEILRGINQCSNINGCFGFAYALGRNKKIIMDQTRSIEAMNKPEPEFEMYQRERADLIEKKLAKKNGDQVEYIDSIDHSAKIPLFNDPEAAEKELDALAKKHSEAIELRKKKNRDYIKFFTEESIEIEFYLIKKEHLPEDKLTPAMIYGIIELFENIE